MSSLDEEATARAQHILNLPHEQKNMGNLVTTSTLIRIGLLSSKVGTKVPFQVFRDGRPLNQKSNKASRKRAKDVSPEAISDEGTQGRASTLYFFYTGRAFVTLLLFFTSSFYTCSPLLFHVLLMYLD